MPIRKIRKPRFLGAVTAIALASAAAVALLPGAAAAQVTPDHSVFRATLQDSIVSPCTNEIIEWNMTYSVTVNSFMQPGDQPGVVDKFKYTQQGVTTGEGEGSFGNHYRMSTTFLNTDISGLDTPYVYTLMLDMRVIGEGDAPDFLYRARERLTANANGIGVYFDNFSAECR